MGKRALKLGIKSGILPEVRPVFKRFPIRPKTQEEIAEEARIEQGYSEGVPLPKKKGFKFERRPSEKPVVTVEERIKRNIDDRKPKDVDTSNLTPGEIWELKKADIRREHLREAYLTEAKRLEKLESLRRIKHEKDIAKKNSDSYEESKATVLTLPTIDSYLKGPIMRQRTEEEELIVQNQRLLNRKTLELEIEDRKAENLLDLYHGAASFITTEEELEQAIKDAFEVNISKFESNQMVIENHLSGYSHSFSNINMNESIIMNKAFGQINGQPGLETVKETLSGESEKFKHEAQMAVNQNLK